MLHPTLIDIATLVVQRTARRRVGYAPTGVSIAHALAVAVRYFRIFIPLVVLLFGTFAARPTLASQTGECTHHARNGMCANYYTRITEDSPGWNCAAMGNYICGDVPLPTYYPIRH